MARRFRARPLPQSAWPRLHAMRTVAARTGSKAGASYGQPAKRPTLVYRKPADQPDAKRAMVEYGGPEKEYRKFAGVGQLVSSPSATTTSVVIVFGALLAAAALWNWAVR